MNKFETCNVSIVTFEYILKNGLYHLLRPSVENLLQSIILQMMDNNFLSTMQEKNSLFTITLTVEHTDGSKLEDDNRRLVHNEELQDRGMGE